ncbi:hypothetical protein [Streptomyces sp. NPDC005805]|uniref:hypothetical protein n=1 Tax=Streptomyces sp. NPDC005805 TaxID=3157068 RepID=UPI00340113A2
MLAGDDATLGRIAHVKGLVALARQDPAAAAGHFREAAGTIPADAPGGPPAAVGHAAAAVAAARFDPRAALRSAHRAAARRETRNDAWATCVARYALALADHTAGRGARARRRVLRLLESADGLLPDARVHVAARRLLDTVESGDRAPGPPCGSVPGAGGAFGPCGCGRCPV